MSEEQAVDIPSVTEPAAPAEVIADLNPAEPATEAKVDKSTPQDDLLPKPDKQQSRFDKKIAKLYKEIGAEKARAELLAKQVEDLRPKPEVKSDGLRLEDFDFDVEKYAEAKAKVAREEAIKQHQENQQDQSRKQAM